MAAPSTSIPTMTKCPFSNRSSRLRVVVKLNSVSFQCRTLNTCSVPKFAMFINPKQQ